MRFKMRTAHVTSSSPERAPEDSGERRRRYTPVAAYHVAECVKREGVDLANLAGPWRAIAQALRRPGRNGANVLPIVTDGLAAVMVDTMEHAIDLAGLLNWSGVEHLNPVPDLRPPLFG